MTNFKIGQQIICVDESGFIPEVPHPIKRKIYTIESFCSCSGCGLSTIVLLEIKGYPIKHICGKCDGSYDNNNKTRRSFRASRFAPLQNVSATSEILERFKLTEEKADVQIKELEQA